MRTLFCLVAVLFATRLMAQDTLVRKMTDTTTQLKALEVTSFRPRIERKADRMIFNVQNSILASGSNVWDALKKTPGVRADDQGQVAAGNKAVSVYIDDKPVQLSGEDLVNYLSSLPSDQLSKIEVITNPPAKYDAQGGAVINIVTKKSRADGMNATVSGGYTQATYGSYNGSTVFNYRKDRLNIYGNYGYSDKRLRRPMEGYTIFETPTTYADWENSRVIIPETKAHSYQLGADYNIDSKQVAGFRVNGYNGSRTNSGDIVNTIFNNHATLPDSALNTTNRSEGATNQYSFNLNYKARLDSNGRSLNIDLDYVPYRNHARPTVYTSTRLADGKTFSSFNIYTPYFQDIDIWSGKLDYTYRVGGKWNMGSGAKYTAIHTDNAFDYYDISGEQPAFDLERSNHFRYDERTAAVYTSIDGNIGSWGISGGLRAEYTRTTGHSLTLDTITRNNYLKLFPTLSITYKRSEDHEFSFNFNRRITRPAYQQLNPARTYSSPYSFQEGNAALQPFVTTNADLNYTFKRNYTLSASFVQLDGLFSNVSVQDNVTHVFYDTQLNLGYIRDFFLTLQANVTPAPWWELNAYATGFYRDQASPYLNSVYRSHNWVADLGMTNSFVLSKSAGLKAELQAHYTSFLNQGVLFVEPTNDLSIGVSKSVLRKQGTLKLAASDLLYGNGYTIGNRFLDQHNGLAQKNDTRSVTLSFSYRFGKNIAASRNRSTASEDEKRRAN